MTSGGDDYRQALENSKREWVDQCRREDAIQNAVSSIVIHLAMSVVFLFMVFGSLVILKLVGLLGWLLQDAP